MSEGLKSKVQLGCARKITDEPLLGAMLGGFGEFCVSNDFYVCIVRQPSQQCSDI